MSLIKREKTAVIKRLSVRMEGELLDSLYPICGPHGQLERSHRL